MKQITPQNIAPLLTETLGEYVSEELCAKLTDKQQRLCYVKATYKPVDPLIIRQILETAKKKVEKENTALRQDAISKLKEDKNREKVFDRFMSYSACEVAGAIDRGDYSLQTLI